MDGSGAVAAYKKEFVTKLTHLEKMAESEMMGAFLRGLKEVIKIKLRVLGPATLDQAMTQTEKIDQKIEAQT